MNSQCKAMKPQLSLTLITTLLSLTSLKAKESDRVFTLPGQPQTPSISQFSGYITVNKDNGRALFYWFFEAQTLPAKKPLLLWLNGGRFTFHAMHGHSNGTSNYDCLINWTGPGCSSIGYGAAAELGPLRVKGFAAGLEFNEYAWNKEANLLFLESPVGVGFSYSNTSSDYSKLDDDFVAEDAYSFLVNWLRRFPQYAAHDFYISGESYAGHYVPQLAEHVYERNKDRKNFPFINLKGFIVGNPETDDYYDTRGLLEYAWSHTVISDQMYNHVKQVCNFKLVNWTKECNIGMFEVYKQYKEIDIYNIYAPICNAVPKSSSNSDRDGNSLAKRNFFKRMRIPAGYDPCYSNYVEEYFNRVEVQRSLHAKVTRRINEKWKVCNDSILNTYNYNNFSVLPIYSKLIKAGLRIWVYSGDSDGRVPVIGTRYCVEALNLSVLSQWRPWYFNSQVGGRFVEYQGLSMVTVRGAGHLVPLNKPREALVLINSFLAGKQLPTVR